jgi:hypothetical protein
MELNKIIVKRKSIRKFKKNSKIFKSDIDKITKTVLIAPSAKNLQSYSVFIIKKEKIPNYLQAFNNKSLEFLPNAVMLMIFCPKTKQIKEFFGRRKGNIFACQDATIAAVYAMLEAENLGYSTCWIGNMKAKLLAKLLNISDLPLTALAIGKRNENPVRKPRNNLNDIFIYI